MAESAPNSVVRVRYGLLASIVISGLLTIFLTQASSPDYRMLFWNVLRIAVVHLLLAGVYFLRIHHWSRWLVLSAASTVIFFFGKMAWRVWL